MFRLATYCVLGMVLAASCAVDAQAQGPGANSKTITWRAAGHNDRIFVGILGEVAKPGVYELNPISLTLQSVIRNAGGITSDASQTIRIVRNDRVVHSIFFTPLTEQSLLPDDLLIVESKLAQAAVSKLIEGDPRLRATAKAANQETRQSDGVGVQLAMLNVLDRPVIVRVKHEEANLINLVQKLGQPVELAEKVRVISPQRLLSQPTQIPTNLVISPGSVLIFPGGFVIQSRLPNDLPLPYGIANGAAPSLIGGSSGHSPELRNVGQLPPLMARPTQNSMPSVQPPPSLEQPNSLPFPSPMVPSSPMAPPAPVAPHLDAQRIELPPPAPATPVVSSSPRIATLPFSGTPPIKSSSSITSTETVPDPSPIEPSKSDAHPTSRSNSGTSTDSRPREGSSSKLAGSGARDDATTEDSMNDLAGDELESNVAPRRSSTKITSLLGIVAAIAFLIGVAIATRRMLEAPSEAPSDDVSPNDPTGDEQSNVEQSTEISFETESGSWESSDSEVSLAPINELHRETVVPNQASSTIAKAKSSLIEKTQSPAFQTIEVSEAPAPDQDTDRMPVSLAEIELATERPDQSLQPVTAPSPIFIDRKKGTETSLETRLNQLIHNELQVRHERVTFPREVVLQGRIASPPVYRLDSAVATSVIQAPHFEISPAPVSETQPAKVIIVPESTDMTDEVDGPHAQGPTKPHFMRRRQAENTVAAKATKSSSVKPTEPKNSSTPLTDALRQLQGGQS